MYLDLLLNNNREQQASDFYLLQDKMTSHFDYKGELLVKILKKNPAFLLRYFREVYSRNEKPYLLHPEPL